jgi:hypothetical protein
LSFLGGAAGRIEKDSGPYDAAGQASKPLPLTDGFTAGPHRASHKQPKFGNDFGSGSAVLSQASVPLELEHRPLAGRSEDSVYFARIKTQLAETALQLGDVLTSHHGSFEKDEAISQSVTSLVEIPPGLGPHLTICRETPISLKAADGLVGSIAELASSVRQSRITQSQEPVLDIPDRLS